MQPDASPQQTGNVRSTLERLGYTTSALAYLGPCYYAAIPGDECSAVPEPGLIARLRASGALAGIAALEPLAGADLAARARKPAGTEVRVGNVVIGGRAIVIVAGPCSIESREQLQQTALAVRAAGAHLLRGGAYKPRTSPYAFQGLGRVGLQLLAEAGSRAGLPVVTEVMAAEDAEVVADYADMLQVGARNMQNFPLLKCLGKLGKPVLLKRSPSATLEEWLGAAEYLLARGNDQVVLCERGIRGFDPNTRNTLDLSAVPALHELTHLPVLVDPSHGTGRRALIPAASRAAVAAGADGLCLEVHVRPEESISDREQALAPADLEALMPSLTAIAAAVERALHAARPRISPERWFPSGDYSTTCRAV
ncbi:MAG: 3-deoxy-7-phosphoheptulonate synthase [Terriglobales bacterium]